MDGASVPPILSQRRMILLVSLCVTTFYPRLVVWATPVAHKSKNAKLKMNYNSGSLRRPVIFEVKDLKRISTLLQPSKEAPALSNGILM